MNKSRFYQSALIPLCLLASGLAAMNGCGGGGGGPGAGPGAPNTPSSSSTTLEYRIKDVTDMPIQGAIVTVTAKGVEHQATTGTNGLVEFSNLPNGEASVSVSATGFETGTPTIMLTSESQNGIWTLEAEGAWAVGRSIVLGTQMVEQASDGSAMTFSIDIAVIDENAYSLETLTSADFSIVDYDCGWFGPRACASDAEGNSTGSIYADGDAQAFELRPPSARGPYVVGLLVERSNEIADWIQRGPALKAFFTSLGGNDIASLASIQMEDGETTLTVLGDFTRDGSSYLDAIDSLAGTAANPPAMLDGLIETIGLVAEAGDGGNSDVERTVLVLTGQGLTTDEIEAVTALAVSMGVHVSIIYSSDLSWYGFSETSMRTGGFAADFNDSRQLGMIFGAMDPFLGGVLPHYRMQFRVIGDEGTFVSGGNAKLLLRIDVPTTIPNRGVYTSLDVAIP